MIRDIDENSKAAPNDGRQLGNGQSNKFVGFYDLVINELFPPF